MFALLALLVTAIVIGNVTDQAREEPLADPNATATADNLTLVHEGGDNLGGSDVTVILRQNDTEQRYDLDSFNETRGQDATRFSSGERWGRERNHTLETGIVRVLVVHEPSNSVVHDQQIAVRNRSRPFTSDT